MHIKYFCKKLFSTKIDKKSLKGPGKKTGCPKKKISDVFFQGEQNRIKPKKNKYVGSILNCAHLTYLIYNTVLPAHFSPTISGISEKCYGHCMIHV